MSVFAWKEEYSVGIREIDDQHKQLVAMVNAIHKAMSKGEGRAILGDICKNSSPIQSSILSVKKP